MTRSENYLINKNTNATAAQLGLQPITVQEAQGQASGPVSKESVAAPAPGPAAALNTTSAAAIIAANLTTTGPTQPLISVPIHYLWLSSITIGAVPDEACLGFRCGGQGVCSAEQRPHCGAEPGAAAMLLLSPALGPVWGIQRLP